MSGLGLEIAAGHTENFLLNVEAVLNTYEGRCVPVYVESSQCSGLYKIFFDLRVIILGLLFFEQTRVRDCDRSASRNFLPNVGAVLHTY